MWSRQAAYKYKARNMQDMAVMQFMAPGLFARRHPMFHDQATKAEWDKWVKDQVLNILSQEVQEAATAEGFDRSPNNSAYESSRPVPALHDRNSLDPYILWMQGLLQVGHGFAGQGV
jgi:hypothetical protein